jgi:hypothetical protein
MVLFQQPFLFEGPQSVAAATLCVNTTGAGGCYTEIQAAIDAASQGDVITVDAGTYNEHITMTNGVSIYGQGWLSTTIDGGYSMAQATVYIPPGVSASTVLSGVQITGGGTGDPTTSGQDGGGIAIWWASPSIVNTWVYSSTATNGGGVFVRGGSPTFDNVPVWFNRANQRGGGFYLDGGAVVTITGNLFEDTNGTVWLNSAEWDGGGFYMTGVTTTLTGLRVNGNTAPYGGGVYIYSTSNRVRLLLNDISFNSATTIGTGGAGIRADSATNLEIVGNAINGNTATGSGGGAAFGQSAGLVQWNWFKNNTASGGSGGGVTVYSTSTGPTLQGNWFEDNSAGGGGGLNLETGAAPLVDANTFVTNTASIGGGIYLYQAGTAKMTNNIVARNTSLGGAGGGVVIVESPGQIINNTITDNTGDGVWFSKAEGVAIINNIISGNSGDGIERYALEPTTSYTADYNDLYNNTGSSYAGLSAGAHDMSVDPKFVAAGVDLAAYYHIQATSPVSATGSTSWAPQRDIDGELRISGGSVSMGADEIPGGIGYSTYLPLILRSS